jgi:hypothetical protein
MKLFVFIIFVTTFQSCNNSENKQKEIVIKNLNTKISNNIIGTWSMCASFDGTNMMQYNVCPTISFNADGTGSEGKSLLGLEKFNWIYDGRILKIFYTNHISNSAFSDSTYAAIIKMEKGITNLILSAQNCVSKLYLSH